MRIPLNWKVETSGITRMNKVNYKHHGDIRKLSKHDILNGSSTHKKTITTWKLLRTHLCYEFHGHGELALNQLED